MATERKSFSEDDRRRSGQFGSGYSDEKLYELVGAVVMRLDPIDPVSVSQPLFDRESPAIASEHGWPTPPRAHGITQRLKKSWLKIKEEATEGRNIQQVLARADGGDMAPWLDERYIHFALRRVALHLEQETLLPHEYERGRHEVIKKTKRMLNDSQIEELLPTRGQLLWLLQGHWEHGLGIAEMAIPAPNKARGHDILKLAEHYYETKGRLPATLGDLRNHAPSLGISYARRSEFPIEDVIDELIADRARRKLTTPDTGPVADARLSPDEIDALIADAPEPRKGRNFWADEERVVEAFADFVETFEGTQKLTNAVYNSHRAKNGWPGSNAWQKHGKFQELVDKGRKRARARRRKAA